MEKIKVLLSSRPKLLSEVIRNMLEHQPDMEVIGEVIEPIKLLRAVRATLVDVVIVTPLKANGEPQLCRQLLVQHPLLKIVTQSAQGETAYLYQSGVCKQRINDPSAQSILGAIRGAMRRRSSVN
jgi:DNA-binding NarL/FixJ family response regulator